MHSAGIFTVNHADISYYIVLFEVTVFIHIQYKMSFSVLFLVSLTLSYLPLSLSYRDGARTESCYNMLVMHTNFLGQTVSPIEFGNTSPYELRGHSFGRKSLRRRYDSHHVSSGA